MAKKTLYFDSFCGYVVSVATESGKLSEFNFEKPEGGSIVGNVYKGRVESVLPGMHAAFVNCGLERNCYLSADDLLPDGEKYDGEAHNAPSFPDICVGDEILVQVVKEPVGKKGAKVTAHPTFVGKTIIYMPQTPFIGVSRKIGDDELRKNLAFAANKLKTPDEGIVLRTAAPYAKRDQIEAEYTFLKNTYEGVKKAFAAAKVGDLLHTDFFLPARVLRDMLTTDIESIVVGNSDLYTQIESVLNLYPNRRQVPLVLHDTGRDMFDELGLAKQILAVSQPRANLDNGAYLIIEKCEALTVIDVNTGKFTGDDSLEQTVYYTNVLAAREIARQVRLRNIGGIVVVDFIDMQNPAHKKALVDELERALKSDRAKCVVSPMSRFGLVEFTRKRIGGSPFAQMVKPCRYCRETGHTRADEVIIFNLRAKILNFAAGGATALRIDMNAEILTKLLSFKALIDDLRARTKGVKIYAVPHRTYHEEQLNFRVNAFEIPDDAVKI